MNKKIDGYKLNFSNSSKKKILYEIEGTLKSGNLSSGKNVLKLENYFKNKFNYKYAIACSSGGGALELIFNALNSQPNLKLCIYAISFNSKISKPQFILLANKKPSLDKHKRIISLPNESYHCQRVGRFRDFIRGYHRFGGLHCT